MQSYAEQNRAFGYAVAASLALHAVLLFASLPAVRNSLRQPAAAPAPLVTRLVKSEAVPEAPKQEEIKLQEVRRQRPKPTPKAAPQPAPEPAPPQQASAGEPESPPAAAPSVVLQSPAVPQAQSDSAAFEATTAGQYRVQLIGAARRYKSEYPYPAIARSHNWTGSVVLDVAIRADGRAEVSVRRSSGYDVLDQQALELFRRAVHAVPVPPALRGKAFALEPLPMLYNLID